MPRGKKAYHADYLEYVNFIVNHDAYKDLPINKGKNGKSNFVTIKNSKVGRGRLAWIENKATELGYEIESGVYARVMRDIHPTKCTTCQICGNSLSVYYYYPSKTALNSIEKRFNLKFSYIDHIGYIWDSLIDSGLSHKTVGTYFLRKVSLKDNPQLLTKDEIIEKLEYECRVNGRRLLGPGAMADPPDRFDGFHSYNRCCRKTEDRGRWKENMDSYNQDRRVYENWSNGNIRAANQFMRDPIFKGISADHIGPISLGFVHDPRFFQPMTSRKNSSKRDRISQTDIDKIVEIEQRTNLCAASWYARELWTHIKSNYLKHPEKIESTYYGALKQNMSNFMFMLHDIFIATGTNGENVIADIFLKPTYLDCFDYDYKCDAQGNIIEQTPRNRTERGNNEYENHKRRSIDAVFDYALKNNRRNKPSFSETTKTAVERIISLINGNSPEEDIKTAVIDCITSMQQEIIQTIEDVSGECI